MKRYFMLLALVVVACAMPAFGQVCPSGASWCSGLYKYDGMGNIRAIGSDTYIYDTVGRLVSGTAEKQRGGISEQDYEYDTFGNRTSASRVTGSVDCLGGCEQAPTIDPLTNHITGNSAAYDAAGNLISITNTVGTTTCTSTYVYDAAGSMARATAGSDDRQFIYTADDERIATRSGQSWTWTVRGLDSKVLREFTSLEPNNSPGLPTSTRQWAKDYVWRDGQLLASVAPSGSGSTTHHFHLDHLGTPRLVSNDNGVQTGIHAYYPFGAELNLSPNEQPSELMKFTGHERDILASNPNTLDYMHARYEMGTMGRFLSVDPELDVKKSMHHPQVWNRYAYVRNNPINAIDPDGKDDLFIGDDFTDPFPAARRSKAWIDNATASALISFIPGYGDAYDAISAIRGRDLLTGDKIGTLARIAGVALPFIGVGGLNKVLEVFRGGSSMVAAAKDVKIIDGLVQTTHGVSLNKVASEVEHFEGGAYRVTSIPDGLQIIQRGTKNANHLEIVPTKPMSMEDYQKLLNEVKLQKAQ